LADNKQNNQWIACMQHACTVVHKQQKLNSYNLGATILEAFLSCCCFDWPQHVCLASKKVRCFWCVFTTARILALKQQCLSSEKWSHHGQSGHNCKLKMGNPICKTTWWKKKVKTMSARWRRTVFEGFQFPQKTGVFLLLTVHLTETNMFVELQSGGHKNSGKSGGLAWILLCHLNCCPTLPPSDPNPFRSVAIRQAMLTHDTVPRPDRTTTMVNLVIRSSLLFVTVLFRSRY